MKAKILALRAISGRFGLGFLRTAMIWLVVIASILILIIGLLAYFFSNWWWLATVPVVIIAMILSVIGLIAWFILKRIQPPLTKPQRQAADQFASSLSRLFENATTPYPLLAGRVVIEAILRKKDGLIQEVTTDSSGLRQEFSQLESSFKEGSDSNQ